MYLRWWTKKIMNRFGNFIVSFMHNFSDPCARSIKWELKVLGRSQLQFNLCCLVCAFIKIIQLTLSESMPDKFFNDLKSYRFAISFLTIAWLLVLFSLCCFGVDFCHFFYLLISINDYLHIIWYLYKLISGR